MRPVTNFLVFSAVLYVAVFNMRYFGTARAPRTDRARADKLMDRLYYPMLKLFGPSGDDGTMRRLEPRMEKVDRVVGLIAVGFFTALWLVGAVNLVTSLTTG